MSETDLVAYATLWYIPLVFGLYGLYALQIQKKVSAEDTNALRFIFSGKDTNLLAITVGLIMLSGIFGAIFFLIPIAFIKPQNKYFHFFTAFLATLFWVLILGIFLIAVFPSL